MRSANISGYAIIIFGLFTIVQNQNTIAGNENDTSDSARIANWASGNPIIIKKSYPNPF